MLSARWDSLREPMPGWTSKPAARVEAMCYSGGLRALLVARWIWASASSLLTPAGSEGWRLAWRPGL